MQNCRCRGTFHAVAAPAKRAALKTELLTETTRANNHVRQVLSYLAIIDKL